MFWGGKGSVDRRERGAFWGGKGSVDRRERGVLIGGKWVGGTGKSGKGMGNLKSHEVDC